MKTFSIRFRSKRRNTGLTFEVEKFRGEQFIDANGDTLEDLLDASSGSGSGLPLLVSATVIVIFSDK